MLQFFLGRRRANRAITRGLYAEIVAAARNPVFYSRWGAPDTPLGRFEMLALYMVLVLRRLRGEAGAGRALAQEVTDTFFGDVDHSLRELGIGDMGVPKRIKKLARMFYGRAEAYSQAIDAGDVEALAAALSRNVRPDAARWPEADQVALYVLAAADALRTQETSTICAGTIRFPAPLTQERITG